MAKSSGQQAPKSSNAAASNSSAGDKITDPRFAHFQTSALYRLPSKKRDNARLDPRFAHMLRDERFSTKAKVDRYGRQLRPERGNKELEKMYTVEAASEPETRNDDDDGVDGLQDDTPDDDEEVRKELERVERKYDPARDGGFSESSSEDETSDEDDAEDAAEAVDLPNQQTEDTPKGEVSYRMAAVNLDWDNIRAVDLMATVSSFLPKGERILKVSVYPSEFGKERMEKEELEGPPKEIFAIDSRAPKDLNTAANESDDDDDADEEDEEKIKKSMLKEDKGEEFNPDQLRRYQLERLRYFYAVLVCSSKQCAEAIYNAVDGTEYLSTANFFDLRFIPDDMDFSEDKPRDECMRVPDRYRPNEFVTDALQHSKVKLTWDADDVERKEAQKRAFSGSRADIDENDLQAYLGSDSSEEEDVQDDDAIVESNGTVVDSSKSAQKEAERSRTRALLGLGVAPAAKKSKDPAPVGEMQVTFASGLSGETGGSIFENEPIIEETTVEKYVRKEKERKARRKEKMKLARNGDTQTEDINDGAEAGQNTVHDEKQGKDLGFDDPFFTAPEKGPGKGTSRRKEEKQRLREQKAREEEAAAGERAQLELLMVGENSDPSDMKHFDANQLERGEKLVKKKWKSKNKLSARHQAALEAKEQDTFAIDLQDPRFMAVHDRSDFAVDPSHPNYKNTEGMKALLEETRKKRSHRDVDVEPAMDSRKRSKRNGVEGEDMSKLVARVKGNAKDSS